MKTLIYQRWCNSTYEHSGSFDGFSLHASMEDREKYIDRLTLTAYRPMNRPVEVFVTDDTYNYVMHGVKGYGLSFASPVGPYRAAEIATNAMLDFLRSTIEEIELEKR